MPTSDKSGNTGSGKPTLPDNVCIFSPTDPSTAKALLTGRIFTRLAASAQTEPAQLVKALKNVGNAFHLTHRNAILIFDGGEGDASDLQDTHHEHFRAVCVALKDHDIGLDVAACIFDASEVLRAGFQLDQLSGGAVLVIDLMGGDDDDDSDDETAAQGYLMGGDSDATIS